MVKQETYQKNSYQQQKENNNLEARRHQQEDHGATKEDDSIPTNSTRGSRVWLQATIDGILLLARLGIVVKLLKLGQPLGLVIVFIELVSIRYGVSNWFKAKHRDYSAGGIVVPACYVAGLWLLPANGLLSVPAFMMGWFAIGLVVWALRSLRDSFTIGGSSLIEVVQTGPYKYVRHPQSLARLVLVASVFLFGCSSWMDVLRCLAAALLVFVVVAVEESYLGKDAGYRAYKRVTTWKLIPGLF